MQLLPPEVSCFKTIEEESAFGGSFPFCGSVYPEFDAMLQEPQEDGLSDETFPPLPPPYSPGQGGGQEEGELFAEEGELSKLVDVPAAKPKGVKRPQPKLDSQRLISERGLPALRSLFQNVHFKGKGHEAEDLRLLMLRMENWAHRLFPKLQFEDFIERVEKLGAKKEVQTCLKRIRLDMPLTHEDFQEKDGEEEVPAEFLAFQEFDPISGESSSNVHSTPAPPAPSTPSLTEEQLRLIELNRQRALERRLARRQPTDPAETQTDVLSTQDQPAALCSAQVLNAPTELHQLPLCPSSDAEPPAGSEAEPPAGSEAEPPPECPAEPPAGFEAEPPAGSEAEPPPGSEAEPPAGSEAEPPPGSEAEPPPGSEAEPPPECPAEPPAGFEAEPPAGSEAEPPAGSEAEPPAGSEAEPPPGSSQCEDQRSEGLKPALSVCEEEG